MGTLETNKPGACTQSAPNAHSQVFLSSLLILSYSIIGFMSSSDQAKGQALSALFPVIVEMKVENRETTSPPQQALPLDVPRTVATRHLPASLMVGSHYLRRRRRLRVSCTDFSVAVNCALLQSHLLSVSAPSHHCSLASLPQSKHSLHTPPRQSLGPSIHGFPGSLLTGVPHMAAIIQLRKWGFAR